MNVARKHGIQPQLGQSIACHEKKMGALEQSNKKLENINLPWDPTVCESSRGQACKHNCWEDR